MSVGSEESAPATHRVFRMDGEELDCNLSSVMSGIEVYNLIADNLSCSAMSVALVRENGELLPNNLSTIALRPGEVLTLLVRSALAVRALLLQERDELIKQMHALRADIAGCERQASATSSLASRVMHDESISVAGASSGCLSAQDVQILLQGELDEALEEMLLSGFEAMAAARGAIDTALAKKKPKQLAVSSPVGMPDLWLRLSKTWSRLQDLRCQFWQHVQKVRRLCRDMVDLSLRLAEAERHFHRILREIRTERHSDGSLMEDIDHREVFCKHPYLDSFCHDPFTVCDELFYGMGSWSHTMKSYLYDDDLEWCWFAGCWDRAAVGVESINFCCDLGAVNVEAQDPWADELAEQRWRRDLHLARHRARSESYFSAARRSQPTAKSGVASGRAAKQKKLPKKKGGRFKPGEHKLFGFQM